MPGILSSKKFLTFAALALALLVMWSRQIDDGPIISDAGQSLLMAINLERHGTLSLDEAPPFIPTNFREPLSPIVTAVGIKLEDLVWGAAAPQAYFSGKRLQFLKYQNVAWLALLAYSAFWAVEAMTASFSTGLVAAILVSLSFRPHFPPGLIDDLMSEIPAAAVLVPASAAFAFGAVRRKTGLILLAGFLFGLLALIKAMALYVAAALTIILAASLFLQHPRASVSTTLRCIALFVLSFACIVGPWIVRNWTKLHTTEITQRASYALQERWYEDQMTPVERKGAFYFWAPFLKDRIGSRLGFSADDLLPGGRLQRLNDDPDSAISQLDARYEESGESDKAVTFYRRARAEVWRVVMFYQAQGNPFPQLAAEAAVKNQSMAAIKSHLGQHLSMTPLFLWRGTMKTAPILLAAFIFGLWRRNWELALFVTPTLGIIAAYSVTSPYFTRYDVPMHLLALVTLPALAVLIYRDLTKGFKQPKAASAPSARV